MNLLERAIQDGHVEVTGEGPRARIRYAATGFTDRYGDPEEKVRADFWAELIYRYGYEARRIGVEVVVPDRRPTDVADVVVFHDDARTRPFAVFEIKPDGISDAEFDQAVEQACGSGTWSKFRATYVGVVAGRTRRFLDFTPKYGVLEREANIVADLPRQYGRPEDFRFHKGGPVDIEQVDKETLAAAINKCHQTLWGGGKLSPPAAFGELCKIISVKIGDEKKDRGEGEPYEFQIKTHETSHRLADRIRALYDEEREASPDIFSDDIKIDDATLRTVVSHLESINLSDTELDTKGVAFEQFMDGFFKGDFGQYFTPREIVDFAIQIVAPTKSDYVIDPACGSAGFLLYTLRHIRDEAGKHYTPGSHKFEKYWEDFARDNLYGIEINGEIARVAKMNMVIHGDGHTNIVCADALGRLERIRQQTENMGFKKDRFHVVVTNPPFGAQVSSADRPYLADYELGTAADARGTRKPRKAQKTEILFIERIWDLLVPGKGRAAVVLPDGILTNASLQYVRDFMLERFQLLAVVSLPQFAFAHYGAGVKASIVFLRKRAKDEAPQDDEPIFMAAPESIGYDATGRKTVNQLPRIVEQYEAFKKNPKPFFV